MPMTVDDLIKNLEAYRNKAPNNGKAEIMLEFDQGIAFEFFTAEEVGAMRSGVIEKFLVLRPRTNKTAKRLEIKPKIFL